MLIQNNGIDAVTQAMTRIVEDGHRLAGRVERFSDIVALGAQQDAVSSAPGAAPTRQANTELGHELNDLARSVARFSVLGRLASLQLGMYSVIATDGRG